MVLFMKVVKLKVSEELFINILIKNMKKTVLLGLFLGALTLSSCKKDWTCVCENVPLIGTYSETIKDKKKLDAKSECGNKNTIEVNGVTYTNNNVSCSLK